jgi:hypothetical protein
MHGSDNQFANIPHSLQALKQWVCWKSVAKDDGKPTKVPVTIGGYGASSADPSDWYSFEEVCEAAPKFAGVGFVFWSSDPFCGIDLDNCFHDGEVKEWASPIINQFAATYAEISPSGKGIKIICRGCLPVGVLHKVSVGDGSIEIYDSKRFFTVTGQSIAGDECVDRQAEIDWLVDMFFKVKASSLNSKPSIEIADNVKVTRASQYLSRIEPAISGSKGHDTTFRAACKMVLGFDLSVDQAFDLMAGEYNPRCQPPWSEKDLRHKVESANKQTGERGYLIGEVNHRFEPVNGVDISGLLGLPAPGDPDAPDDETFFGAMVPESGLIREIFDYYKATAFQSTNTMGLAIAVSLLQTVFGRRVQSHTELRTNDYNIILAGTSTGKEACEATSQKIFNAAIHAAGMQQGFRMLIPPDVQSGNALAREVAEVRCALWICDEFGKHLSVILDKKQVNTHAAAIGTYLLKVYNKANQTYLGASHAAGNRCQVEQPHLCLLGMTTGSVFNSIGASQIEDGLFGRLAWWPVQHRPKRSRNAKPQPVPENVAEQLGMWIKWQPGFEGLYPSPAMLEMEPAAKYRWESYSDLIRERMDDEAETRAAVWARVAARAMKLAIVHRCARFVGDPASLEQEPIVVESVDVEWGIKVANWLAKIACDLVRENVVDSKHSQVMALIMRGLQDGERDRSWFLRQHRKLTAGDISAAAKQLAAEGLIEVREESTKGRPKTHYSLKK